MRSIFPFSSLVGFALLTLVLLSCASNTWRANPVQRHRDAGSVSVSVVSVAPWDEYVDSMQPTFQVSEKSVLSAVIPTTQTLTEKVIDSLAAELKVAPSRSGAKIPGQGREKSSGDPGDATIPENPAAGRKAQDLPGTGLPKEISVDPMAKYRGAAALYQELNMLNRNVRDAAQRRGFRPYIVRMQISVIPSTLGRPYDVVSTMSLFNGTLRPSPDTYMNHGAPNYPEEIREYRRSKEVHDSAIVPYVIPMLVTDNLEASMQSRTINEIRQLGFALDLLLSGFGGSAGLNSYRDTLNSIYGRQINSLLTVSRLADNSVRFRLGAPFQAQQKRAMVPQNHYVTLLVLADADLVSRYEETENYANAINVILKSSFVDTRDGRVLPADRARVRDQEALKIASRHIPRWAADRSGGQEASLRPGTSCDQVIEERIQTIKKLDAFAQSGPQSGFKNELSKIDQMFYSSHRNRKNPKTAKWFELWIDIVDLRTSGTTVTASLDLPLTEEAKLPTALTTAILLDDKKSSAKFEVSGGRGLRSDRLRAHLQLASIKGHAKIPANDIKVHSGGDRIIVSFPSPHSMGLSAKELDNATVKIALTHSEWKKRDTKPTPTTIINVDYRKSGPKKKQNPRFTMKASTGYVVADKLGNGDIRVFVEFDKHAGTALISSMKLFITGADLTGLTKSDGTSLPTTSAVVQGQSIIVKKDLTLVIKLKNLSEKQTLKIEGVDSKDREKSIVEVKVVSKK